MLRGEIRLVELGQAMPGGAARRRPAVVISNDGANATAARLGRVVITVVSISQRHKGIPVSGSLTAEASGLDQDSKAQAEQVRSVSVVRVLKRLGSAPAPLMLEVDEALRIHLALLTPVSTSRGLTRLGNQLGTRDMSGP